MQLAVEKAHVHTLVCQLIRLWVLIVPLARPIFSLYHFHKYFEICFVLTGVIYATGS